MQLYRDRELVESGDVVVEHPNHLDSAEYCFVAWFNPADTRSLDDVWTGCEGLFPIADNGCNDQYLVDLSQEDPDVLYHLHETGERARIGCRLSGFLAAPRRFAADK